MKIHDDAVLAVARLAKLALTSEETNKFGPQVDSILNYVDTLQELDTNNVIPTRQITGLTNVTRSDLVAESTIQDELLDCSPLTKENHHIVVPSVFA